MNNTFSIEQLSRTGNNDANPNTPEHKLDLMARLMEIKAMNPKLEQIEMAKQINHSSSTLQRYRSNTNMLRPYRIPPYIHKRRQKPQMKTSDDLN